MERVVLLYVRVMDLKVRVWFGALNKPVVDMPVLTALKNRYMLGISFSLYLRKEHRHSGPKLARYGTGNKK